MDQDEDGITDDPNIVFSGYFNFDYEGTTEYCESIDYFPLIEVG
jgi:hypothetical protein